MAGVRSSIDPHIATGKMRAAAVVLRMAGGEFNDALANLLWNEVSLIEEYSVVTSRSRYALEIALAYLDSE